MSYEYITKYNAKCFTPGRPYGINAITIHWWDEPSNHPSFDGVISTFVSGSRKTSAHYIAEAGRVACVVDPDDRAWACGDGVGEGSGGNDKSISIECNPRQSNGDYETIAQLIADLRSTYGNLPLYPHRHWTSTTCPGTYDLTRLDNLARGKKGGGASQPAAKPAAPAKPSVDLNAIADAIYRGEYGNGMSARRSAVDGRYGAGTYDKAQAIVNRKYYGQAPAASAKPSVDLNAIADAIYRGEYGNGMSARRSAVDGRYGAGTYDKAQAIVNRKYYGM
jgi:hypothetical protein